MSIQFNSEGSNKVWLSQKESKKTEEQSHEIATKLIGSQSLLLFPISLMDFAAFNGQENA